MYFPQQCSEGCCVLIASPSSNLPYLGKVYTPPINVPAPLAFFPLTEGTGNDVSSYPYPEYAGGPNGTSLRYAALTKHLSRAPRHRLYNPDLRSGNTCPDSLECQSLKRRQTISKSRH